VLAHTRVHSGPVINMLDYWSRGRGQTPRQKFG